MKILILSDLGLLRPSFFYLLFYHFFRNKLGLEDDFVFPSTLIQLENGPDEFYFYFTN